MRSLTRTLKPVRDRMAKAAQQLKGISGRPLVVVLGNPGNRMPLSAPNVISAMYGDPSSSSLSAGGGPASGALAATTNSARPAAAALGAVTMPICRRSPSCASGLRATGIRR